MPLKNVHGQHLERYDNYEKRKGMPYHIIQANNQLLFEKNKYPI
jgi:hypothetical protein